tara:strand:- start:271 stop:564 length:294 start_codon:yes stop_codon:yes gene_type:complete
MPMSDKVLRAINKGRRKAGLKPIRRKKTSSSKIQKRDRTPSNIKSITYNYETKTKALQKRKEWMNEGFTVSPPFKRKMKVPHGNNNYYYWSLAKKIR